MVILLINYSLGWTHLIYSRQTFDKSSSLGAIILHGPHHVAKKSMTTSLSPASANLAWSSSCNDQGNTDIVVIHTIIKVLF